MIKRFFILGSVLVVTSVSQRAFAQDAVAPYLVEVENHPSEANNVSPQLCSNGSSAAVDEILGTNLTFDIYRPISTHYTLAVLTRARDAIEYARSFTDTFGASIDEEDWLGTAYSAVANALTRTERGVANSADLTEHSACLHIDLTLIEAMMERVRCEIVSAYEQKHATTITLLVELMSFLEDRYNLLLSNGRNNTIEDQTWWKVYSFDRPQTDVWCCNGNFFGAQCVFTPVGSCALEGQYHNQDGCVDNSTCIIGSGATVVDEKICPFHSDYLPPSVVATGSIIQSYQYPNNYGQTQLSINAYGCDLDILRQYAVSGTGTALQHWKIDDTIEAEYLSMRDAIGRRDGFLEDAANLKRDYINFETWLERDIPPEIETFGLIRNAEHTVRLGCNASDGSASNPPAYGSGAPLLPKNISAIEPRGPFHLFNDESRLMNAYRWLRDTWGILRPYPKQFRDPQEFERSEDAPGNHERITLSDELTRFLDTYVRQEIKNNDRAQERSEGLSIPKGSDAQLRILQKMDPIRVAVGDLSTQANMLDAGFRNFTRGFAYWIRKTCITRPCNDRLDNVLKIVLQNRCFPYTNGEYIENTSLNDECKAAADIEF